MHERFTRMHRAGEGPPLVCIHGFTDTWRTWDLVLPALERRHDVLAPTLPGHAGGPPLPERPTAAVLADEVERALDAAGMDGVHAVGNSLGGYVALQLAERGRALSVVALAPAGGWAPGDRSYRETLAGFEALQLQLRAVAPYAGAIAASAEGRRRALQLVSERGEDVPPDLVAHMLVGAASCQGFRPLIELALREGWPLRPEQISCPVRIVWGTADRLLRWPASAIGFQRALPQADWVELDGVGHCPQLDVPLETAQLILGLTAG
jgi:pimeloyl-ACP methyl ester carboxylesterase